MATSGAWLIEENGKIASTQNPRKQINELFDFPFFKTGKTAGLMSLDLSDFAPIKAQKNDQVYYPIKLLSGKPYRGKSFTFTATTRRGGPPTVVIKAMRNSKNSSKEKFEANVMREININNLLRIGIGNGGNSTVCGNDVICIKSSFAISDKDNVLGQRGLVAYIVYPYQDAVSLVDMLEDKNSELLALRKNDPRLYTTKALGLAYQMTKACAALHALKISQADLKPDNMIVSRDLNKLWIIDFDLACVYDPDDQFSVFIRAEAEFGQSVSPAIDPTKPDKAFYFSTDFWADPETRTRNGNSVGPREFTFEEAKKLWPKFDVGSLGRVIYALFAIDMIDFGFLARNALPVEVSSQPPSMPYGIYAICQQMAGPIDSRETASENAQKLEIMYNYRLSRSS